jgi:hypothetical protein
MAPGTLVYGSSAANVRRYAAHLVIKNHVWLEAFMVFYTLLKPNNESKAWHKIQWELWEAI